jgi:hypothetical protein
VRDRDSGYFGGRHTQASVIHDDAFRLEAVSEGQTDPDRRGFVPECGAIGAANLPPPVIETDEFGLVRKAARIRHRGHPRCAFVVNARDRQNSPE